MYLLTHLSDRHKELALMIKKDFPQTFTWLRVSLFVSTICYVTSYRGVFFNGGVFYGCRRENSL